MPQASNSVKVVLFWYIQYILSKNSQY